MSSINYAKYIDNTLLAPQATEAQIKALCKESRKYNFASVCVNPCFVKSVNKELKGSKVTLILLHLGQVRVDLN